MNTVWKLLNALMVFTLVGLIFLAPVEAPSNGTTTSRAPGGAAANIAPPPPEKPEFFVSEPVTPHVSPPARDLSTTIDYTLEREINPRRPPEFLNQDGSIAHVIQPDALARQGVNAGRAPALIRSFEGVGNLASVSPPDPNGDVGPNHYIQMVNVQFAIFDKSGTMLSGPTEYNALFDGAGGNCESDNAGDPIVLYDELADRWLLSQFASPTHMCVAISQTPDPTGSYYLYEFNVGSFPDYFKFGVWPDGYYMSANENTYTAYAFDRVKMLAGLPATFQKFTGQTNFLLPSDVDGATAPPAGSPNYFYTFKDNSYHGGADRIEVFAFTVNWTTPANSTFALVSSLDVTPFTYTACGYFNFECIRQQGTTQRVDSLGEWPLFRFPYRNFGSYETLVGVFGVGGGLGEEGSAQRWFELRKTGTAWALYQEGTYDPGDGHDRFNGSVAMDQSGNMALGFSVSSSTLYPSIRYTTRLASDPPGTMQTEAPLIAGGGSQTGSDRWGDYSSLSVDPADGCTFWYTDEYYQTSSSGGWKTRIGSFKLSECGVSDFALVTTPAKQSVCAASTTSYTTTATSLNGYKKTVTLSVAGAPLGATASFNPASGVPDFGSTLTLANLNVAGSYTLVVSGVSVSRTHANTITLQVDLGAPGTPVAADPADGATDVVVRPVFTWDVIAGAAAYDIQISTDPAFSVLVASASGLIKNTYTPAAALDANSSYYWRVRAANGCGAGAWSESAAFATQIINCSVPYGPEGFESGAGGWTSGGTGDTWRRSTARFHSGSYAFLAVDTSTISDQRLASPAIALPDDATSVTLTYWNQQTIEDRTGGCYDGGILEISTDGGSTWSQIPNARLQTDPYDGPIASNYSNPLAGLNAWCGDPADWRESKVDLSSYTGQTIALRFRLGTDSSSGREGWYIDDVQVEICRPALFNYSTLNGGYGLAWHTGDGATYLGPAWDVADGVTRAPAQWTPGAPVQLQVNAHSAGFLAAWFDWNDDGVFQDTEKEIAQTLTGAGVTGISLTVPADEGYLTGQQLKARFRFYDVEPVRPPTATETFDGDGGAGEVEDYTWDYDPNAVTLGAFHGRADAVLVFVGGLLAAGVIALAPARLHQMRERRKRR